MNKLQAVREFMERAGQAAYYKPVVPSEDIRLLRVNLIREELNEFAEASGVDGQTALDSTNVSMYDVADGLADLLYVVYGAAVAWGIDVDEVFAEVHRSNMSKFIDGHRREDGKWVKGPSYSPADVVGILAKQMD